MQWNGFFMYRKENLIHGLTKKILVIRTVEVCCTYSSDLKHNLVKKYIILLIVIPLL